MQVLFKGEALSVEADTMQELQTQLETRLGVQKDQQRLFQKRRRVNCTADAPLSDVLDVAQPLVLMAGASKLQIEEMHKTQEAAQREMRIRENRRVVDIGKKNQQFQAREAVATSYRFHEIEPLKQFKDADKAREILETLANDRGILAVVAKHKWSVGVLAEMPPDGKVGVDPVCVLGLNQNKGQKILLRLRTDDLLGFRKFLSIKKVLFHELTHNVHSEHDSKFYQLMRQVEKECDELDWTSSRGALVGGTRAPHYSEDDSQSENPTGHRLGGGSAGLSRLLSASPAAPVLQRQPAPAATTELKSEVVATLVEEDKVPIPSVADIDMENVAEHVETTESHELEPTQVSEIEEVDQHMKAVDEEVATLAMSDRERRIHDAVQHLRRYNAETISKAVSLLHKIISNIITHPADAKYRSIRKANRLFEGQVAKFPECLEFLLALGFEDQSDKFVLVREDPALLWIGRSTLEVLLPTAA